MAFHASIAIALTAFKTLYQSQHSCLLPSRTDAGGHESKALFKGYACILLIDLLYFYPSSSPVGIEAAYIILLSCFILTTTLSYCLGCSKLPWQHRNLNLGEHQNIPFEIDELVLDDHFH